MAEKDKGGNFCMWVGARAVHDIAFSQFLEDLGHTQTVPSLGVKHHALLGALTLCGVRPKNPNDPVEVSVLYMQLRTPYGGAGGVATPSSLAVASQTIHSADGGQVQEGDESAHAGASWNQFVKDGALNIPPDDEMGR